MRLLTDVVYAVRLWRRNAGSTLAALAALSFGIAGTTAMFGIVSALLLQPLPISDSESVVNILTTDKAHSASLVSMPDAIDLKQRLQTVSGVALASEKLVNMSASNTTLLVHALAVDPAMFTLMGIRPAQGTSFGASESVPGQGSRLLVSWGFWQSQFGGRSIIGEKLRLDDRVFVIAGVLPRNLDLPFPADLWLPLEADLARPENQRAIHGYYCFARLRPGMTLTQLDAELSLLSSQLAKQNPAEDAGVLFQGVLLRDWIVGDIKTPLFLLLAAVAGVLLIACANVANLLLARSATRMREICVRIAVGASRAQLIQQFAVESVMLAICSAAAGVAIAGFALRFLRTWPGTPIPRPDLVTLDWRVLVFAICVAGLTAVLFGTLPALRASGVRVNEVLKQAGGRASDSRRSQLLRRALLTFETALTTVLLIGSMLLLLSYKNMTSLDPGFQTGHLLTVFLSLPDSRYGRDSIYAARFAEQVLPLIRALPGVTHAAMTRNLPLTPGGNGPIQIEGRPAPVHIWEEPFVMREEITAGYRQTLGIPLLSGRDFDQREEVPNATGILINQATALKFFRGQNPIGKRLSYRLNSLSPASDWHEIVGVIGDTRRGSIQAKVPAIFVPLYRAASPYPAIIVRTEGDPAAYARPVEQAVHKVDPTIPCFLFHTMDELMAQQFGWRAFNTSLLGIFALVALLLASVGVFSVVSYSVSQRTSEIGLRMACGASTQNVLIMILLQGLTPAAMGTLVGMFAAMGVGRYLESMLSGVSLQNPALYAGAALFVILIAAVASILPARWAASVDPWLALRYE